MNPEPKTNPNSNTTGQDPTVLNADGTYSAQDFTNNPTEPAAPTFDFQAQANQILNQPSNGSSASFNPPVSGQPPFIPSANQLPPAPTPAQQGVAPIPKKVNPNSSQNALQIAEIRDGIVILNDGTYRSVIMVKPINFDLMSPDEKEAVEFAYQGFLNAMYFPIQIFIHSERVDISPYINKLDKMRLEQDNMLLAVLMEDYLNFMVDLSQHTNIMDKGFYIIVPYSPVENIQQAIAQSKNFFTGLGALFSKKEKTVVINEADLAKAKDELRTRVEAILGGLAQCNIKGLPLDTQELIELYYDTYNPDTAVRQQLKNFNDLNPPVVTKGPGLAPQPNLDVEGL
ncbi:MAG TPA: hypothetical protein VMR34_00705 [Candidatus Saccharimonadales bacterium]|nr:hypothetical protein [Candidatus Saccharimonadales bacterium]